ncbi:unnamed protein product [Caenorhabditis nigoni]
MNCEDVKKFLVQRAKELDSPISLRKLSNEFNKQYPQSSAKVTPKQLAEILDNLESWSLPIEERIRIAFMFQTKVSTEMEEEIKQLPNSMTGFDEKNIIVCFESPALFLNTRKQTREQTRNIQNIRYVAGQVPVPQNVDGNFNNINVDTPPQRRASPPRRANQQNVPVQNRADLQHRLVSLSQLNAGLEVIARGQQPNAQVEDPAPLIAVFDQHIRRNVAERNEGVRLAQNNQHGEELPDPQSPPEPRIKIEPTDNDIIIVETPAAPKVAKMAQGVAKLAQVYGHKDLNDSAMKIAGLPTRLHKATFRIINVFISKKNIEFLIAEFLVPQCELRTM